MIELTNEAIIQLLENQKRDRWKNVRLGITGGGCAGFEYVFGSSNDDVSADDVVLPFGKFNVLGDKMSVPYLSGMTLDFVTEGLNKVFKFINPKEEASCGCGVSINFNLDKVETDKNKIFAVEL